MTLDQALDHIEFVRAIDVPANACLVIRSERRLTIEQAERILRTVEDALPGRKVLVLPPELDLTVVRDGEAP